MFSTYSFSFPLGVRNNRVSLYFILVLALILSFQLLWYKSLSRACVSLCRMLAQVGLWATCMCRRKKSDDLFSQRESPNWDTYRYAYIRCIPKRSIHRLTFRLPASSETRKRAYSLVSDEAGRRYVSHCIRIYRYRFRQTQFHWNDQRESPTKKRLSQVCHIFSRVFLNPV